MKGVLLFNYVSYLLLLLTRQIVQVMFLDDRFVWSLRLLLFLFVGSLFVVLCHPFVHLDSHQHFEGKLPQWPLAAPSLVMQLRRHASPDMHKPPKSLDCQSRAKHGCIS